MCMQVGRYLLDTGHSAPTVGARGTHAFGYLLTHTEFLPSHPYGISD